MTKIYVLIHACSMGKGQEILLDQLERLKRSKIPAFKVFIFYLGVKTITIPLDLQIELNAILIHTSTNSLLAEQSTIREFSQINSLDECSIILYIHTKGINYSITLDDIIQLESAVPNNNSMPHFNQLIRNLFSPNCHEIFKASQAWRFYMEYILIDKWEKCVEKIKEGYDVVGTEMKPASYSYLIKKNIPRHYAGNFWWMTMKCFREHLHTLQFDYNAVENWHIADENIKAFNIWNSNKDLYREEIKPEYYKNTW